MLGELFERSSAGRLDLFDQRGSYLPFVSKAPQLMLNRHYDRARGVESAYRRQLRGLGHVVDSPENSELLPNMLRLLEGEQTKKTA